MMMMMRRVWCLQGGPRSQRRVSWPWHGNSAGIIFTNDPTFCRSDKIPIEERKRPDCEYRESIEVKLEIQDVKGEWGEWIMPNARAKNRGTTLMISKPKLNKCAAVLLTIKNKHLSAEQQSLVDKGVLELSKDGERLVIIKTDQYSCKQAYEHGLIGPEIKVNDELWRWDKSKGNFVRV
jgi:hypothetical protein